MVRAPWRQTGDALVVGISAMMPVGRIGCLVEGCCMGAACGHWAPFCLRYASTTQTYDAQVRAGVITGLEPLSLPAHPLPVYFAITSLVILGVLLWLHHRGAPAGTLLVTFLILEPLTKLALEPFRAVPRLPGLMVGVPAAMLFVGAFAATIAFLRRSGHGAARAAVGRRSAEVT
jgi:prolipoprotein diacylglyceryltransferase